MRRHMTTTGMALGWGICVLAATAPARAADTPPSSASKDGSNTSTAKSDADANTARGGDERARGRDERQGRDGGGGPGMLPILKALDSDGDGVLSTQEIDNAAEALRPLDTNKDGKLTREEMFGNMGQGGRREGGRGEGGGGGGPAAGELVTQLMAFDKNGDGKLAADELPERMRNLIERADANKDGFLDKDELTRYAEQQQQGQGNRGEGRGGPGPNRPGGGGPGMLPLVRALDADGNGELSASEIANAPAALRTLDKNKDGKLTRDELMGEMGQGRGGRGRGGFGPGGGPGPRGGQ